MCLGVAWAGEPQKAVVTGDGVALRAGPGTNHPIFKRFNKGDTVEVLGQSGDWVKVAARAFVGRKHVENLGEGKGRVTASGLYVRSEPRMRNGNQVRTVGRNHVFDVVGVRGSWLEVSTHAYVHGKYLAHLLDEIVVTAPRPVQPPRPELEPIEPPVIEIEPLELEPIEITPPAIELEPLEITPPVLEGDPVPAADGETTAEEEVLADLTEGDPVLPTEEPLAIDEELTLEGDPIQPAAPAEEPVVVDEELNLDAGDPLAAPDEQADLEAPEMTPELEQQILQDLLTLPMDEAYALHGEDNPNFQGRAEFEQAVQELRDEASGSAVPSHEIDGTYVLKPGFWIGRKPVVVVEVKQAQSGGNDFVVLHKVFDRKKQKVDGEKKIVKVLRYEDQAMGTWDPEKRRLEVTFNSSEGVAGRLSGRSRDVVSTAKYTIHTTGEIRGTYVNDAGRDSDWVCSSKGWREGSIVPVAGYYELKPSWYAFGYKPTVKVWLDAQADGTFAVRREVHEQDGRVISTQGVGVLDDKDDREVVVNFGNQHPPIRYGVANDGRIRSRYEIPSSHRYTSLRDVDRSGESRAERGFRDGIEVEKFPTGLRRAWAGTKRFFSKSGRAVGRFGKMLALKTWAATKWVGKTTWGAAKWTAGKVWDGTKWVGARISDGAKWVWDGTKWVAVKAWDGTKWVAIKTWDGTKWVASKTWGVLKEGGSRAWGATKAVGGGFRDAGRILVNGVPEEVEAAPVERLPIDDDGSPVVDIELGGDESEDAPVEGDPIPAPARR